MVDRCENQYIEGSNQEFVPNILNKYIWLSSPQPKDAFDMFSDIVLYINESVLWESDYSLSWDWEIIRWWKEPQVEYRFVIEEENWDNELIWEIAAVKWDDDVLDPSNSYREIYSLVHQYICLKESKELEVEVLLETDDGKRILSWQYEFSEITSNEDFFVLLHTVRNYLPDNSTKAFHKKVSSVIESNIEWSGEASVNWISSNIESIDNDEALERYFIAQVSVKNRVSYVPIYFWTHENVKAEIEIDDLWTVFDE